MVMGGEGEMGSNPSLWHILNMRAVVAPLGPLRIVLLGEPFLTQSHEELGRTGWTLKASGDLVEAERFL